MHIFCLFLSSLFLFDDGFHSCLSYRYLEFYETRGWSEREEKVNLKSAVGWIAIVLKESNMSS